MPNPNAIVSKTVRLAVPPGQTPAEGLRAAGGLTVELDDGRSVRLDPENPRSPGLAQVLEGAAKLGRPVYLEIDPETGAVTRIYLPRLGRVIALHDLPEGYNVELDTSHARHVLRRDSPDFADFERVVREALAREEPVILSETDSHDILDLRFFGPGPADWPRLLLSARVPRRRQPNWAEILFYRLWYLPLWPWWWWRRRCVSWTTAKQAFDAMSATTCNPLTVPPPCIPFMFPDDGCWGRAHEMCRLMIAMGLGPRKVWIDGWPLNTPTRNHPDCHVVWGWHVAPTLCVRLGRRWWRPWARTMVIDPSLFTEPVTVADWKSVQNNPAAVLTYTAASDFQWGLTDPTYALTNGVLADYRLDLYNRSISPVGPPPYANCP